MKIKELKLYNKYYDVNEPNIELFYIGVDQRDGDFIFLYKKQNNKIHFNLLKHNNFELDKITNNLNLEIGFYKTGDKYIKDYDIFYYSEDSVEEHLKLCLKDKLNNILYR